MTVSDAFQKKDHFSDNSNNYNRYRPGYPAELFEYLSSLTTEHQCAWDCATGSGQAAVQQARFFDRVIATDASENQVNHAISGKNIGYVVSYAEQPPFKPESFDLITVAQALHWFDIPTFLNLVKSILKPEGILALWSYNLLSVSPQLDEIIYYLYGEILDDYWPDERKYVEVGYSDIEFPLTEIKPDRTFNMQADWSLSDLIGYLNTWSAVKRYRQANSSEAVDLIIPKLKSVWGNKQNIKTIKWPLNLRIGRN